jgi:hypothetical protein
MMLGKRKMSDKLDKVNKPNIKYVYVVKKKEKQPGMFAQLKKYLMQPRLSREEKKFIIQNYEASEQEIRDIIANYFYLKSDLYDIKDDIFREPIVKLIKINSIIRLKGFKILEKYFEGKEEKSLDEKEQKIFDLMINFSAIRALDHNTLTEAEETVRIRGRQMYDMLEDVYSFELLEKYFKDKPRETLSPEDQVLFDIVKKYGANRKPGDKIMFLISDLHDPFGVVHEMMEETERDREMHAFYAGTRRYNALEEVEKIPNYAEMSYKELQEEQRKLYTELKEKERVYERK